MGPVTRSERLDVIDVVRGFALLGILAANIRGFMGPQMAYFAPHLLWTGLPDTVAQFAIDSFVQMKFVTIFTVLFGIGFAIQMDRAEASGRGVLPFVRRVGILLLIGMVHAWLIWWGDILIAYALWGVVLLAFRRRKQKTLLIWSAALYVLPIVVGAAAAVVFTFFVQPPAPSAPPDPKKVMEAVRIYSDGSFVQILQQNFRDWLRMSGGIVAGVIFELPRFLFGVYLWRTGVLQRLTEHAVALKRIVLWGMMIGLPLNLAATTLTHMYRPRFSLLMMTIHAISFIGVPLLSAAYVAGVALWSISNSGQVQLHRGFNAIGRTALSNYLLQSLVGTFLFYSYGLELMGTAGPAIGIPLTVAIFSAQMALSIWWLNRFQFGPVEWLWRWGTYGHKPPMRIKSEVAAAAEQA